MPDDRDPAGTASTVAPRSDAGTDATVAAGAGPGRELTLAAPLAPVVLGDLSLIAHAGSSGATTRTVGDDLRGASIERFDEVARTRFELLGELARGGLGRVMRARDPRTGRVVALKEVLRPSPDLIARFAREAMVTANLQHPAIVPVYEVGRWPSGEPFYAMKLVRGRALDALIAEATTTAARVALLPHVIAIAEALAYAHSERVIHRDLKPANVLVGPYGETVVIDWGLARNLGERDVASGAPVAPPPPPVDEPGATVAGAVLGTPAYMPPEQAAGAPLDERADVYAIGAILYHVLAGQRPYAEQRTVEQLLQAVEAGPPRALAELAPGVPAELATIVAKAMARAPADRYPTAEGLADDLRRFQTGQLVGAHRYSPWQRLRRWVGRHRAAVATGAVAVTALVGFGIVSVSRIARERDEAQRQRAAAHVAQALAERRVGETLEELGRQALLAGDPERALPFLAAAGGAAPDRPTLAVMTGQALAPFAGLRAVLPRRDLAVVSADLLDGGRRAITATENEAITYDVASGAELWRAAGVHQVLASPDGGQVLCAGPDREVTLRRAADGVVVKQWTLAAPVRGALLAWSHDGQQIAVTTGGGVVALGARDAATLTERPLHQGEVWTVAFAPDDRRLVTVGEDGALAVLELSSGAVAVISRAAVAAAWIGPTGLLSVDRDGAVRRWAPDAAGRWRTVATQVHGADPYSVYVAPSGDWAVTVGAGPRARLWDLRTDTLRADLVGHSLGVFAAIAVGPYLVTADEPGGVLVWDPATGARLAALPFEELSPSLAVRGDRLLTFGSGRPRIWQLRPEVPLRQRVLHDARVRGLAFDPVRPIIWSASNDGTARGLDLTTGAVVTLGQAEYREAAITSLNDAALFHAAPRGLRSMTLASDDRLITAREDGAVTIWDRVHARPLATWSHDGRARRVILSRDGRRAYVVAGTTLYAHDAATGAVLAQAPLGAPGWDVALLADDTVVATLDDDHRAMLWDAATLTPRAGVRPFPDQLRDLLVVDDRLVVASPEDVLIVDADGGVHGRASQEATLAVAWSGRDQLAVAASVGDLALRRASDAALIRRWRVDDGVAALAYRPDGALLASAGGRRVRVWDPATGRELFATPELPALMAQLAWSADGRYLAFGGGSGVVYVWDLGGPGLDVPARARCLSPWRLDGSGLTAAEFDPSACREVIAP